MKSATREKQLDQIIDLLPTRSERKAAAKHLAFLEEQIAERQASGESTQVMRIAHDSITKLLKLSDAVRDTKVATAGNKSNS